MSRSANPVAVGLFTLITLVLAGVLVMTFSGSNWWSDRDRYVLVYDSSVRGLNVGAPVTLKGVKIGQVVDIRTSIYGDSPDVLNLVTIDIDASTILRGEGGKGLAVEQLVDRGLRAQLRQQSMLTGLLYVDVDFEPGRPAHYQKMKTDHPQLPTTPTNLQQLTRDLEAVDVNALVSDLQQALSGINQLLNDPDLQSLAGNLARTVQVVEDTTLRLGDAGGQLATDYSALAVSAAAMLDTAGQELPGILVKLDDTLEAMRQSARNMDEFSANAAFMASDDSPILYRLNGAAKGINEAADQLRLLSDLLEQQPQMLLYGKPSED
ncbi:MAG: MlaD family protein [Porticoccaceae bacterium]|nr:MlaD family protein [Porticoccaceae bacterium]